MREVDTAGLLFLFYHEMYPRAFVCTDSNLRLISPLPEIPVRKVSCELWSSYELLHPWLHAIIGNTCRGRPNNKIRRNGGDSEFSALVRRGPIGGVGCYDTPLMDIDGVVIDDDGRILRIWEDKWPGERMDSAQSVTLRRLDQAGLPVELRVRAAA